MPIGSSGMSISKNPNHCLVTKKKLNGVKFTTSFDFIEVYFTVSGELPALSAFNGLREKRALSLPYTVTPAAKRVPMALLADMCCAEGCSLRDLIGAC